MRLSRNKIRKILKKKRQSPKKYKRRKNIRKKFNKTQKKKGLINLRNKSVKKYSKSRKIYKIRQVLKHKGGNPQTDDAESRSRIPIPEEGLLPGVRSASSTGQLPPSSARTAPFSDNSRDNESMDGNLRDAGSDDEAAESGDSPKKTVPYKKNDLVCKHPSTSAEWKPNTVFESGSSILDKR